MARKKHASFKTTVPETRKNESLAQKKAFLIAYEGECTELNYIKNLVRIEKIEQEHCRRYNRKNCASSTF